MCHVKINDGQNLIFGVAKINAKKMGNVITQEQEAQRGEKRKRSSDEDDVEDVNAKRQKISDDQISEVSKAVDKTNPYLIWIAKNKFAGYVGVALNNLVIDDDFDTWKNDDTKKMWEKFFNEVETEYMTKEELKVLWDDIWKNFEESKGKMIFIEKK